jgi:hypothetical protein
VIMQMAALIAAILHVLTMTLLIILFSEAISLLEVAVLEELALLILEYGIAA